MRVTTTGVEEIRWQVGPAGRSDPGDPVQLVAASLTSAAGFRIGVAHELTREQVRELVAHLTAWLDTGSLAVPG